MSSQNNTPLKEVDMRTPELLMRLTNRELLRLLMQHTGTGAPLTVRELADAAGCSRGTVGNLLTGQGEHLSLAYAQPMVDALGVDLLVLFTPTGRSVPAPRGRQLVEAVPA